MLTTGSLCLSLGRHSTGAGPGSGATCPDGGGDGGDGGEGGGGERTSSAMPQRI